MKILLIGCTGQVGRALRSGLDAIGDVTAADRAMMDLADPPQLSAVVRAIRPDLIVNAAAYTAVDRAEAESDLARRVNAEAVAVLADEARRLDALLVHYSTDYVFDGLAARPYREDDPARPLGQYGATKLAGEQAIAASGARHLILRTSWVYSAGGSNFMLTMLRLARQRPQLRVVDDQIGAPTWAADVAAATIAAMRPPAPVEGLFHVSASGQVTWCGFARAILKAAGLSTPIVPITTAEYPTAARRPAYSVLDSSCFAAATGFRIGDWDTRLDAFMRESGLAAAAG